MLCEKIPFDSLFSSESYVFIYLFIYGISVCFENVPCKAFYSWKNGVWNSSYTMWDSFQTSAILQKTCISYVSKTLAM